MLIVGFNKTTLLDYPGHVAATVFVGGCNFRCPFCHNGGLVLAPLQQGTFAEEEIVTFLKKRKGILKGVCITGGEPTLHADLPEFIDKIKSLGYRVKLDTNGYSPNMLKHLLEKKLLDYVAMDIKNCPDKYAMTTGMVEADNRAENSGTDGISKSDAGKGQTFDIDKICQSVDLLKKSSVPYEFRTTVVKEFHTKEDLLKIAGWIKGCPYYYLQQYQDSENMLCRIAKRNTGRYFHGYTEEEMTQIAEELRKVEGMTGKISLRTGND